MFWTVFYITEMTRIAKSKAISDENQAKNLNIIQIVNILIIATKLIFHGSIAHYASA